MTGPFYGNNWSDLPELLEDAELHRIAWDKSKRRLKLSFEALIDNQEPTGARGTELALTLHGVRAIVVGYEPACSGVRPSEYKPPRRLRATELNGRSRLPLQRAYVAVNSRACFRDAMTAPVREWRLGRTRQLSQCACQLGLSLESTEMLGRPACHLTLVIGGQLLRISQGGQPLDLRAWRQQSASLWSELFEFEDDFDNGLLADPQELIEQGRTYQPPAEPAVRLEPTDVPRGLLEPIIDWFEGHMDRDWWRMARAWPHLDRSLAEHAENIADDCQYVGRWGYARQIDEWWWEGVHAEVTIRGIEHTMPDEEAEACNEESVWVFRLRREADRWVIRGYLQGWPDHGSAPARPASEKPWRSNWGNGFDQHEA